MPSPLMRSAAILLALCSCWLAFSCSSGRLKSLADMARLQQLLIEKYHEQNINVSLQNSRFLFIAFVNSPLNKKDQADRARRAQETARFAVSNYPAIKGIESIAISFVESESRFFIYHHSRSLGIFVFDRSGLALNAGGSEEDSRRPVARFSIPRNETDVSITRLQLEGDLNHGIALVPHFTFKGNVNDANRVAPDWVVFDFASYADRKVFPASGRLDIRCDQIVVFSGTARLLLPQDSASDGSTAQFLTAQIPFAQFSKIGKASQVRIKLGSKNFDLAAEDIESLRAMSAYIPQPHDEARQGPR
jgi:hypothetical protein